MSGPVAEPFTGVEAFFERAHEATSCIDDQPAVVPPPPGAVGETSSPSADENDATDPSSPPDFPEVGAALAVWEEPAPRKRRPLPRKALAAAAVAALLLILPFLTRGPSRAREDAVPVATLPEDLVISERDLRNRIEVTADDFRARSPIDTSTEAAPEFASDGAAATLAERRKQRAQDPEDLVALRGASRDSKSSASTGTSEVGDGYLRPFVYFERGSASSSTGTPGPIAPAGTVVSAVLASPIDLRGGTSTILALASSDGPIAKSSRFVGSASASDDGRLALRFDRLLLPDGREARIEGEAQESTGAFGLQGTVTTEGGSSGAAVAREVARDTAADAASEAVNVLTGGIGGRLLRRTVDRATTRRGLPGTATTRVSLPAGTQFQIFLHQAVVVRG